MKLLHQSIYLICFCLLFLLTTCQNKPQEQGLSSIIATQEIADLFQNKQINTIKIQLEAAHTWDSLVIRGLSGALEAFLTLQPETDYQYLPAKVSINDETSNSTGVRVMVIDAYSHKSKRQKPLEINFAAFDPDASFKGLTSLELLNGGFDETFVRQKLFHDFLQKKQIPTPSIHYANVYLNDELLGLFLIKEAIDESFLKRSFGPKVGHLIEGIKDACLIWQGKHEANYLSNYLLKNKNNKQSKKAFQALTTLIKELGGLDNSNIYEFISQHFNKDHLFKTMAAAEIFGLQNTFTCQNYYLYQNPNNNKFEFLLNQTDPVAYNPQVADLAQRGLDKMILMNKIFSNKELFEEFWAVRNRFIENDLDTTIIFKNIDHWATFIQKNAAKNSISNFDSFEENLNNKKNKYPNYIDENTAYFPKLKFSKSVREQYSKEQINNLLDGIAQSIKSAVSGGTNVYGLKDFFRQRAKRLKNKGIENK